MGGEHDELDRVNAMSDFFAGLDLNIASFRDAGDQIYILGRPYRSQIPALGLENYLVARTYQWINVGEYNVVKEDKFGIYPSSFGEIALAYVTVGLNLLRPDVWRRRKECNMFWKKMSEEKKAGATVNLDNYLDFIW